MRRRLTLIASLLLGLILLGGLILYFGPGLIWQEIQELGWLGWGTLAVTIVGSIVCWTAAWHVLMRAYGIRLNPWLLWKARLCGFSISYLTPSAYVGGEPLSLYLVAKEGQVPATRALATLMVSKLLEGLSLLGFIVVGSIFAVLAHLGGQSLWILETGIIVMLGLLVVGLVNFIGRRLWLTRLVGWCKERSRWKRPLAYLEEKVRTVEDDICRAFQAYRLATLVAFSFTLLATTLMFLRPQVFFYFADQQLFSFAQLAIIFALIAVVSSVLWITPGGIGVFEGGMVGIFALLGISQGSAVAYGLALKMVELPLVGLGLLHLVGFGLLRISRAKIKLPDEALKLEAHAHRRESAEQDSK